MKEITYAQAINEAISEEMRRDENVFMMGEDIGLYCGAFGVSRGMIQEFGGDRIMDTPIAEQAYVGAGVGAAMCGMRPIVELMFSDFMCVCFDAVSYTHLDVYKRQFFTSPTPKIIFVGTENSKGVNMVIFSFTR